MAFACPICKKPVEQPSEQSPTPWFPFCSERCKLIDLGRWLDGKYQIPVVEDDLDEARDFDLESDEPAPNAPRKPGT